MEPVLNLNKLREMIRNGIASIPKDPNADQAVIFIGDTGAGKSTLMAFLAGAQLTVRYDGLKPVLDCNSSTIKIGHEKYSETSIPNKVVIEGIAFYDCPGFKDNKGEEYQISNSFFVQRLLDIYPKVKIVLLIDESHISEARADKLPKLTKNLLKSFKTFEDIKDGTIVIINRAERDLTTQDYHREIRKMCQLRNQNGNLFEMEEQKFLKFLIDCNRICLFRQPRKEDKGMRFQPNDLERSMLKTIHNCSFVKSKHILNILSESAKLAIRDFIDDITNRSNAKIETICREIIDTYRRKMFDLGSDVKGLLHEKDEVMQLAQRIRAADKEDIVRILQKDVPSNKMEDFSEDFTAVMFFKGIYDKTATYFSNLVNKIYSELSHLLVHMDNTIIKVQKEEQDQMERQKQAQRRKEQQEQRERQLQEMNQQLLKIKQVQETLQGMGSSGMTLFESVNGISEQIGFMDEEFTRMRELVQGLQNTHHQLQERYQNIENNYVRPDRE